MPNKELKPCPFYGSEANLFVSEHGGIRVICPKCGASTMSLCDTMTPRGVAGNATKSIIEKWNRRADNG